MKISKIESRSRNNLRTIIFKTWNCCQKIQNDNFVSLAAKTVDPQIPSNQEFCADLIKKRPCENQPFCCAYTDWAEWTQWATSDWQEPDGYKT